MKFKKVNLMTKILSHILKYIKGTTSITLLLVFILSGVYLLIIDGADLAIKNLKKELGTARIVGFIYIFGSTIAYVIIKFLL